MRSRCKSRCLLFVWGKESLSASLVTPGYFLYYFKNTNSFISQNASLKRNFSSSTIWLPRGAIHMGRPNNAPFPLYLLIFKVTRQLPASFKDGSNGFFFFSYHYKLMDLHCSRLEYTKYGVVFGAQLPCLWPVTWLVTDRAEV